MSDSSYRLILRRLLKWLLWLLIAVLVLFGVSNVWLSSPWASGIAEDRLEEQTGMTWEVGGMSWSPWNGLTIRDMVVFSPGESGSGGDEGDESMLTVDSIQVSPYWSSLFQGRVQLKDLEIDAPRGEVSIEMLGDLAMAGVRQKPAPAPKPSSKKDQGTSSKPRKADKSGKPKKPQEQQKGKKPQKAADSGKDTVKRKPKPPAAKEASKAPSVKPPVQEQRTPLGLPLRIRVSGGEFRLVSEKLGEDLLNAENVSLDFVVLGEDSHGYLDVGNVTMIGGSEIKDVRHVLEWKRPYVQWEGKVMNVNGLQMLGKARVGLPAGLATGKGVLTRGGAGGGAGGGAAGGMAAGMGSMPFNVEVAVPTQKVKSLVGMKQTGLHVSADRFGAMLRCSGLLQSPMSWRGDMQIQGRAIRVREGHGGKDVVFDELRVPAVFRHGRLNWAGVRLIGEDLSVLGNGQISAEGGVLAVTRMVVSPDVGALVMRGLYGAVIPPNGLEWWEDLVTPDRKFRDLLIHGDLSAPKVDIDYYHRYKPLWKTVKNTIVFIRQEMKEEGRSVLEIPVEELIPEP